MMRPSCIFAQFDPGLQHTTVFSSWNGSALVVVAVTAGLLTWTVIRYCRELPSGSDRRRRFYLIGLRFVSWSVLAMMFYGWMAQRQRTVLPDLLIAIDVSQSMAEVDSLPEDVRRNYTGRLEATKIQGVTRLSLAKLYLLENDAAILRRLSKRYRIKCYSIGEQVTTLPLELAAMIKAIGKLQPTQSASRLGDHLREILNRQRGRSTAACLLLTDGVTTQGTSLSEAAHFAKQRSVSLYCVGIGSRQQGNDVEITRVDSENSVFVGDLVVFDVSVRQSGFAREQIEAELVLPGSGVVHRQKIRLQDEESHTIRLSHRAAETGEFEYTVRIKPLDGEVNVANNTNTERITVRDERIKVLMIQDRPSFEFRNLKRLLGRSVRSRSKQENIYELTTVLQDADVKYAELDREAIAAVPLRWEELASFDVLILGDVNPNRLSQAAMNNIVRFVSERGGGAILIAGPSHNPKRFEGTPLAALLPAPVEQIQVPLLDKPLIAQGVLTVTPLGIRSTLLQVEESSAESVRRWRLLPAPRFSVSLRKIRAGSRVLLEHSTGDGTRPVLTLTHVDAGKVFFQSTDESWLWLGGNNGSVVYERYWNNLIKFLSRQKLIGQDKVAELITDRDRYQVGDPVNVFVRAIDGKAFRDRRVILQITDQAGLQKQIKIDQSRSARLQFQGTISGLTQGTYRVSLLRPQLASEVYSSFVIERPRLESAELRMNWLELKRSSKVTSGRAFEMINVDRLESSLPAGEQVLVEAEPPYPIWNSWWVVILLLGTLLSEWALRKHWGLV